jgi:chaperonin GroEL
MLLTTECVVVEEEEENPLPMGAAGGMGGGMPGMM